jgi:phospholipid/cholesterol/gamma-HCH transport system substrate-binding protein
MISAYVKRQLIIFAILTLTATVVIVFVYAHIPTVLGFGQMKVTALFSDGAGIYPNGNVTARGVGIGKITEVSLTPRGVAVTMSVDSKAQVGSDARAEIHSVSAVGEQYVDLITDQPGGPYLADGTVIPVSRTSVPEQIAPVLDKTDTLLASIPKQGLQTFLDEGYKAFQNLGPDLGRLVDSSQYLIDEADQNYAQTAQLINTIGPLLDTQNVAAESVRAYFRNLASFTGVLRDGDHHLRDGIPAVHRAADRAADFLSDNENGAPILAHNLERVGQVLGVYRPGIEQVLVQYPIAIAWEQLFSKGNRGLHVALEPAIQEGCSTGYNSNHQRNSEEFSDIDAEKGTYCNVPHNDPRAVRGVRNIPCLEGNVGMRAATIDQCFGREPNVPVPGSGGPSLKPKLPAPGFALPPRGPLTPPDTQEDSDSDSSSSSSSSEPLSMFGAVGSTDSGKDQTWQSLLTGPLGR